MSEVLSVNSRDVNPYIPIVSQLTGQKSTLDPETGESVIVLDWSFEWSEDWLGEDDEEGEVYRREKCSAADFSEHFHDLYNLTVTVLPEPEGHPDFHHIVEYRGSYEDLRIFVLWYSQTGYVWGDLTAEDQERLSHDIHLIGNTENLGWEAQLNGETVVLFHTGDEHLICQCFRFPSGETLSGVELLIRY